MNILCGTDIVEVGRIKKAIETGARFVEKVYTGPETEYCESKKSGRYESYAARFAAKEAFAKAVGAGLFKGVALTDAEVVNDAGGAPFLRLRGGAAEAFARAGGKSVSVSLSHTAEIATAVVVILCEQQTE